MTKTNTIPLLMLLALAGCGHKSGDSPAKDDAAPATPVVQAVTVARGSIEQVLPATGTVTAMLNREATVIPSVSGQIDALPVRIGQEVVKGQTVAHLSTRTQQGAVEQAEATVAQNNVQIRQAEVAVLQQRAATRAAVLQAESAVSNAKATLGSDEATLTGDEAALRNTQQSLSRQQTLLSEGLIARKDLEAAQLAVQTAQAQVEAQEQTIRAQQETVDGQIHALQAAQSAYLADDIKRKDVAVAQQQAANARGALQTARAQLSLYSLKAPLTGRVVSIGANLGETVDTSAKLVTIANLDRVQVQIAVPSEQASRVHSGQEITFTVDGLPGRTFRSVIQTVGSQVDPTTNAIPAYAVADNPGHLLSDDQAARVRIVLMRHADVLIVPRNGILTDAATGNKSVDVIGSDSVVHSKDVELGIEQGNNVEVTKGLSPGDKIAIAGQYALPDGTKVSVQSAP